MNSAKYRSPVVPYSSSDESDASVKSRLDDIRKPKPRQHRSPSPESEIEDSSSSNSARRDDSNGSIADESMRSERSTASSGTPMKLEESNLSPSPYTPSFATSTPKSKSTASSRLEASYGSSRSHSNSHDRSRSFIENDNKKTMTPITKKLSEQSDVQSKQQLRERLLRKTLKNHGSVSEGPSPSGSTGGWGSSQATSDNSPDNSALFNAALSPIVKSSTRKSNFKADTSQDDIPKVSSPAAIQNIAPPVFLDPSIDDDEYKVPLLDPVTLSGHDDSGLLPPKHLVDVPSPPFLLGQHFCPSSHACQL